MGLAQVFMDGVKRSLIAAGLLGLAMTSCAAGPSLFQTVPESLPESVGGLPADAPAAPAKPYAYPAVHDMPPPRTAKPLDDNQQIQLEKDLEAARDRQMRRAAENPDADDASDAPPTKPAATKTKKKSSVAKKKTGTAPQAGARTNP